MEITLFTNLLGAFGLRSGVESEPVDPAARPRPGPATGRGRAVVELRLVGSHADPAGPRRPVGPRPDRRQGRGRHSVLHAVGVVPRVGEQVVFAAQENLLSKYASGLAEASAWCSAARLRTRSGAATSGHRHHRWGRQPGDQRPRTCRPAHRAGGGGAGAGVPDLVGLVAWAVVVLQSVAGPSVAGPSGEGRQPGPGGVTGASDGSAEHIRTRTAWVALKSPS